MQTPASRRRAGFTLIEIILVVGIIALLATIAVTGFQAAISARKKGRAKGEIQALIMACENYKKTYGDYPCAANGTPVGDSDKFRRQFFDQLIGRKVLKARPLSAGGNEILLINYDDTTVFGATPRRMKSFINAGIVASNDDTAVGNNDWKAGTPAAYEFRDPWGNPYGYRYRILNAGNSSATDISTGYPTGVYADWKSSNFLVVCPSARFIENTPLSEDEYWDPSGAMTKTGIIPATYFDDTSTGLRADNLVNWQTN